jgi:hypothetical protein
MTITLPADLERDLSDRAEQLGVQPDDVVRWALVRFLYVGPELQAELDDWQRAGQKAWAVVEESLK